MPLEDFLSALETIHSTSKNITVVLTGGGAPVEEGH